MDNIEINRYQKLIVKNFGYGLVTGFMLGITSITVLILLTL